MIGIIWIFLLLIPLQPCEECDLLQSGWKHQQVGQYEAAIKQYQQSINFATKNNNLTYLGYALINTANAYGALTNYDSAIHYNQRALITFSQTEDTEQQYFCLINIAECYNDKGLYRTSVQYLQQARHLLNAMDQPKNEYLFYVTIGRSWLELKEFDRCEKAYQKALDISIKHNLRKQENAVLLNMGNLYLGNVQLDRAATAFNNALKLAQLGSDSVRMAMALNNLGEVALNNKTYQQSQTYLEQAIAIKKQVNPGKLSTSYYTLGKLYLEMEQMARAKSYLDSSLVAEDFEVLIGANEGLVTYYQRVGDFQKALTTMQLLDSLKNEQFNNERLAASKLQASIDLNTVNVQLDEQLSINAYQKKTNMILISFGLLMLAVATVLFLLFRSNFKLRKYNELLLKEQNHRVKNNLQMISSLLTIQAHGMDSDDAQKALNESQTRINAVALLHRMLYEKDNLESLNLRSYVQTLIDELAFASPRPISTKLHIDDHETLSVEKSTSLGLIINELVTNSIKHVPQAIDLLLSLNIQKKGSILEMEYTDNGATFDPASWEQSTSFGNQLIRLQSEQLRGKFAVKNQDGFQYTLKIIA